MTDMKKRRGVLVTVDVVDNEFRLRLDDVEGNREAPGIWQQGVHITHKMFDRQGFFDMKLDDAEVTDFGYYIIARLNAFVGQNEA